MKVWGTGRTRAQPGSVLNHCGANGNIGPCDISMASRPASLDPRPSDLRTAPGDASWDLSKHPRRVAALHNPEVAGELPISGVLSGALCG
jgi:hypothetical protein